MGESRADPRSYPELLLSPHPLAPCKWRWTIILVHANPGRGGRKHLTLTPPLLSFPWRVQADHSESQGPSGAPEQTLSQLLRLISKPALGSLQFNASLRIVILSLPGSAAPVLPPLSQSLPFPQLKILHIWMTVFSSVSSETGPPPSLLNKNWAGGALFTHYLFKSSPLHFMWSPQCALGQGGNAHKTNTLTLSVHLNIFKIQVLLLLLSQNGKEDEKVHFLTLLFFCPNGGWGILKVQSFLKAPNTRN